MTKRAWEGFSAAREKFRNLALSLQRELPDLGKIQQEMIDKRSDGGYPVETPCVVNQALDEIRRDSVIKLILVADNPGRREQAAENRRYLVGPSGKLAEKFFREHPELDVQYPSQAIILNKTPIHTPRTADLKELIRLGGEDVARAVRESQREMAELLLDFHRALSPIRVWIIGYSEMRKGGIFQVYTETLQKIYRNQGAKKEELFLFRHFSMNSFTINLGREAREDESVRETLDRVGLQYRVRVLGW